MTTKYKTIIFQGKPGSGKGTQAEMLAKALGYEMFSSGGYLRALRDEDTVLGRKMKIDYDSGKWVPDWFVVYLINKVIIEAGDEGGLVFEGTGRMPEEVKAMDEVNTWLEREYVVFNLEVPDEVVIERIKNRARGDAIESEIKTRSRLEEFRKFTIPSIDFYRHRNKVVDIDGTQSPEEIHQQVIDYLRQ